MQSKREFLTTTAAAFAFGGGTSTKIFAAAVPQYPGLQAIAADDPRAIGLNKAYAGQRKKLPQERLMCDTADAAVKAVNWAKNEGRGFANRSGGHCFMGFSQHDDVALDVRGMRGISIDRGAQTLRVGAGARLDIIYNAINPMGLSLPGGTFGGVGIAGHTLGGGFGFRCRTDGLLIDQLQSVDLVTADGNLTTASATQNADLFWACRGGGGGQFGLATEFTFNLQQRPSTHRIAILEPVDVQRAAEILFLWPHWILNSPRHLNTHLQITRRGDAGFLISLTGLSSGNRDDLKEELRLLLRRQDPIHNNFVKPDVAMDLEKKPNEGVSTAEAHLLTQSHLLAGALDERGVAEILIAILRHPDDAVSVNFEPFGGAVSDVASDATAFPHRNAAFVAHVQADVKRPQELAIKQAAMADLKEVFTPLAMGGVYANYPDLTLENWGQAYWGGNLGRLKRVKAAWDPDNLFRHAHSIAMA